MSVFTLSSAVSVEKFSRYADWHFSIWPVEFVYFTICLHANFSIIFPK